MKKSLEELVVEITANFKRGTTEMLLLALLTIQDWYVYELSKKLKELSGGRFDVQGPSLYTALYRLQDRGFVSSKSESIGRRTRVYYHILPEGKDYLDRIVTEYQVVNSGIMAVLEQIGLKKPMNEGENTSEGLQ